jgi:hypothetical protein
MSCVRYSVFGLCLESNQPLPGLAPAGHHDVPDIRVDVEHACAFVLDPGETCYYTSDWLDDRTGLEGLKIYQSRTDGSFTFRYAEGVEFRINAAGHHVVARFASYSTLVDMTAFLTGPVLGFVLRMRHVIALHACAIDMSGKAIVLAGDALAGKSTTAATFARLGCGILTEDVAPLVVDGGAIRVCSGCTDVALRPTAVEQLYGSVDALPKFSPNWEKRRLDLLESGAFARGPLPLAAVYMLTNKPGIADRPSVTGIPGTQAMLELLANIYANRLLHRELRLHELDIIHRVVSTVPVKAAMTGSWSSPVEQFCEVILDDVRAC